ncbi:MAG: rRNA maturation RNAse YbeY, partial [Deltaproteobacteria bacterium]|nr:rRNA maturation RNAse YbeY [Deltaproteobacteria bacterium]
MPTKRSKLQIASIAGFKFDNDSKRLAHKVFRVAQTRLSLSGDVSLVILDSDECWRLNKKYRHKDYSPDVLTFVYEEDLLGEIVVNKSFIHARNGKI